MATEKKKPEDQLPESHVPSQSGGNANRDGRRRVLKAGLAAVPVIFTLNNRVVLGGGYEIGVAGEKPSGGVVSNFYAESGGNHIHPDDAQKLEDAGLSLDDYDPNAVPDEGAAGYGDFTSGS